MGWLKNNLQNSNLLILTGMLISSVSYSQQIYHDSIMNGHNFEKAAFRLWFEHDTVTIQGVIVLVPGSNGDGRHMVNDTVWQNLASRYDFALIGCFFKDNHHDIMAIEEYADAKNGSGQALIDVLKNLAVISDHPELKFAPLALWGMSAGGEFNYEFACWKPEKVIAFVVNKGGIYYSSLAPQATWDVPAVFFTGANDSPYRNNIVKGIFSINRRFDAKWIFIEEAGVAHECENSKKFAQFYFDEIIPLRILKGKPDSFYKLNKLDSKGYIGVASTKQILPDSEKVNAEITSWFPNKIVAEKWLEFIK